MKKKHEKILIIVVRITIVATLSYLKGFEDGSKEAFIGFNELLKNN